ncbi:MAG: phosphoglucosamine mutase [Bacilli bacterium]|jgi:phosphoglucosamine mutase
MANKYFGTDGIRGPVNRFLTVNIAYRIGRFLGQKHAEGRPVRILIGRDTRASGELLSNALTTGILASGGIVFNIDVTTTPSISYLVPKHDFDFGIMISASHNPYYDNGIKIFDCQGEKLKAEIETQIEAYIDSERDDLPLAYDDEIGRYIYADYLLEDYISFIGLMGSEIHGLKIIADLANGSASAVAPRLFEKLDIEIDFIHNLPNGININERCGSTHMESLITAVKEGDYDIGLAFDGDADRLLVVAPDGQIIDGDAIIYIMARNYKRRGKLRGNSVVLTVMSNFGAKKSLLKQGIDIVEVQVGDKYVQAEMKDGKYSLGGEQSGHIIFLEDLNTGDGFVTAMKILKTMYFEGKSLMELLDGYQVYPQVLKNLNVVNKTAVMAHRGVKKLIQEEEEKLNGEGRILVRPSGTEQLIRVMAEAATNEKAHQVVDKIATYINELNY